MELFDGERNSYEHHLQWNCTRMDTILWDLKHSVLPFFLERESNILIYKINYHTLVYGTYLRKVIPGFLHCFLMEEEFLSSALKIQTEE